MKITVEQVAKELGTSPPTLRKMMDSGKLPIGVVIDDGGQKRYIILPKPLYEETGIKAEGYEPPPNINIKIDYKNFAKEVAKEFSLGFAKFFERSEQECERT